MTTSCYQNKNQNHVLFPCDNPVEPSMRNEAVRLNTFATWPFRHTVVPPRQIAQSGLYYLGSGDQTKCFYCGGGLQDWSRDDDSWAEHAKWFPECEFLLHERGPAWVSSITSRFPNIQRPNMTEVRQRFSSWLIILELSQYFRKPQKPKFKPTVRESEKKVCSDAIGFQENVSHTSEDLQTLWRLERRTSSMLSIDSLCEYPLDLDASNPNMSEYDCRLRTFDETNWAGCVEKERLARAGFYRHHDINDGDKVFCFSCGTGVMDWTLHHDPITVHREFFRSCPHMLTLVPS